MSGPWVPDNVVLVPELASGTLAIEERALTTAELLATSPGPDVLPAVSASEERRGRLERDGDRWRLARSAFPTELLAALAALQDVRDLGTSPGLGLTV